MYTGTYSFSCPVAHAACLLSCCVSRDRIVLQATPPACTEAAIFRHCCCQVVYCQPCRHRLVFAKSQLCVSNASRLRPLKSCVGQSMQPSPQTMGENISLSLGCCFVIQVPRRSCLSSQHLREFSFFYWAYFRCYHGVHFLTC